MKFELSDLGWSKNNKNNTGRNDQRNNRQRNYNNNTSSQKTAMVEENGRGYGTRSFQFESSDLTSQEKPATSPKEGKLDGKVQEAKIILENFLEEYANVLSSRGNQVPVTIQDMFWDVAEVMTHYYESRYQQLVGLMNSVFHIMASSRFANGLRMVLANDEIDGWCDGVHDIWKHVMFTLSTALTCFHGKMKDEVISIYIDLISSDGIAGMDIKRLITENAMTKELALDLIVSIPMIPNDMTDAVLEHVYGMFLDKLLKHASDNVDSMDANTQGKLFSFFFGEGKTALKAIGKMFASKTIGTFENEDQSTLFDEYKKMLVEKLNAYDIPDIVFVLRYALRKREAVNNNTRLVINDAAMGGSNINKAYATLSSENQKVTELL